MVRRNQVFILVQCWGCNRSENILDGPRSLRRCSQCGGRSLEVLQQTRHDGSVIGAKKNKNTARKRSATQATSSTVIDPKMPKVVWTFATPAHRDASSVKANAAPARLPKQKRPPKLTALQKLTAAKEANAKILGLCRACGKELKDAKSLKIGLGPECRKVYGK